MLKIDGVGKRFGGVLALSDISLEIGPGVSALIGANGSGKTTLFNLCTGFLRPTTGRIEWCGSRIDGVSPARIARQGLVRTFQEGISFDRLTVGQVADSVAARWRVPASSRAEVLANWGLDEEEEFPCSMLSFGHTRRLALALALLTRPRMLLLDEPSAGLPAGESEELALALRRVGDGGVAVWVIEHDMSFLRRIADRMTVLSYGSVLADGSPTAVLEREEVIDEYLGSGA